MSKEACTMCNSCIFDQVRGIIRPCEIHEKGFICQACNIDAGGSCKNPHCSYFIDRSLDKSNIAEDNDKHDTKKLGALGDNQHGSTLSLTNKEHEICKVCNCTINHEELYCKDVHHVKIHHDICCPTVNKKDKWYTEGSNSYEKLKRLRNKMIKNGNNCTVIRKNENNYKDHRNNENDNISRGILYLYQFDYQRENEWTAFSPFPALPEEYEK